MTRLTNPQPLFLNARGNLLDAGMIYVGVANADPQDQPIAVFFDADRMIPAMQPLATQGGKIVNGATPVQIFVAEADYSMRVLDADGGLVSYEPTSFPMGAQFQPIDSDLTAIAALATTEFGRSLLTLANAAALKTATGIADCLALSGGTVTGNITRASAGTHSYWADAGLTSGRRFVTAADAADPTSLPGDEWLKRSA